MPERVEPRLSANDLALYMVSSDTARMGILRRAKNPIAPPMIRYRDVRRAITSYLTDATRNLNHLVSAEQIFNQRRGDVSLSNLVRNDAELSIEVLHSLQRMQNQLNGFDFHPAPNDQGKVAISGVEVSVRADMLVHGALRGEQQIGAAVLRMTADDATTELARERRRNIGLYVATLAKMHIDRNIVSDRTAANRLCMSIDIQHGEVFNAPAANARRTNDLESACSMIAAIWPSI